MMTIEINYTHTQLEVDMESEMMRLLREIAEIKLQQESLAKLIGKMESQRCELFSKYSQLKQSLANLDELQEGVVVTVVDGKKRALSVVFDDYGYPIVDVLDLLQVK